MYGTLISTVTVGTGGSASLTLSSIPQNFTDLVVVASLRNGTATTGTGGRAFQMLLNGSTSSRSMKYINGAGNNVYAGTPDYFWVNGSDDAANSFSTTTIVIPNYSNGSNKLYTIDTVGENNSVTAEMSMNTGLWANTAAITSLTFQPSITGNVAQGSTVSVYGVTKGTLAGITVS
jgi:hypothetical protein